MNTNDYTLLQFNGRLLYPSFSIYLFEITHDTKGKFFYLGMTGDNHYPSARSILHRLAGHIDVLKKSTQNQFIKGLKKDIFDKEDLSSDDLCKINVSLHHWPIKGFKKWVGNMKEIDKKSIEYEKYKKTQSEVSNLEKKLIRYCKDNGYNLLNKAHSKEYSEPKEDFLNVYNAVIKIIKD